MSVSKSKNLERKLDNFAKEAKNELNNVCGSSLWESLGRDSNSNLEEKIKYVATNPLLLSNFISRRNSKAGYNDLKKTISEKCNVNSDNLRFQQINIEHHLAHTASAYFQSKCSYSSGITIDGSGDFVTCMMSECSGNVITPIHKIYVPNSLGSFYSMICQFIGYTKYGDEGKVMGLAPLGEDKYQDIFNEMITFEEGKLKLNKKFFVPFGHNQGISINANGEMKTSTHYSKNMIEIFGEPRRPNSEITKRDRDLAASLQKRFESIYIDLFNYLHKICPSKTVSLAGGCALNSVANGLVYEKTPFQKMNIHPAAGDEGLAIGSALYISRSVLNEQNEKNNFNVYLGNDYSNQEIERDLKSKNVPYKHLNYDLIIEETAKEIKEGKVVGWFQGRSEWGPRALGNRSILCHPGFPNMKDILNSRIKRREFFRPFAPAVKEEMLSMVYDAKHPTPHMLHVYQTKQKWKDNLSAVNHQDNTGRVQTVNRSDNPLYYDLICEFEKLTGIPVLLNTSFNENEPIVEKPSEAIECFLRTKMDVLVIGSFIVRKVVQS